MFKPVSGVESFDKSIAKQIIPALVINNNDPLKLQRVQARVSELHTNYDDAHLPWILPITLAPNGFGAGVGSCFIPAVGTNIAVFFPEKTDNDGYYLGGFPDAKTALTEFTEDYPNAYGWVDTAGNLFIVNTVKKSIYTIAGTGDYIGMDAAGISFFTKGAFNAKAASFNFSGPVSFDSPVNVDSGSNAASSLAAKTPGKAYVAPNVANQLTY